MSRENSAEDIQAPGVYQEMNQNMVSSPEKDTGETDNFAGQLSKSLQDSHMRPSSPANSPSSSRLGVKAGNRRSSKSVSSTRPPTVYKRTQSYHNSKNSYSGQSTGGPPSPSPNLLPTPTDTPVRNGLKRRTSTPSLAIHLLPEHNELFTFPPDIPEAGPSFKGKEKEVDTRARSKSTSIAYPPSLEPTVSITQTRRPPSPLRLPHPLPQPYWDETHRVPNSTAIDQHLLSSHRRATSADGALLRPDASILTRAYDIGETTLSRFANWVRPGRSNALDYTRRTSEDSERGLSEEDGENAGSIDSVGTTRASMESYRAGLAKGRYWGLSDEDEDAGYFSLPPTPPEADPTTGYPPFSNGGPSLPTPALSTRSLSRKRSGRRRHLHAGQDGGGHGWLRHLFSFGSGTKTGEVIRELGWTVGILAIAFLVTLGLVLWLVKGMPVTTLKHIPKSTTDLQLLSAEIRSYMSSGDSGWYHTIGVLIVVGCWKHAWSVPGAVVLNILVGSLLEPMPALGLLTFITATGSLLSYSLSRPLAPLIAVLFPKPLALVRAALAPESIPSPPTLHLTPSANSNTGEHITPVQISSPPAAPIGDSASTTKQAVWRRLLVMRAMGFVPWSGMNVACGVVGVNWKTFWLTTAAGSASWSYVTASVGNILSRLALPQSAQSSMDAINAGTSGVYSPSSLEHGGESLTSLLRDPVLIAKLVLLTGLTLLPVVIKKRSAPPSTDLASSTNPSNKAMNPAITSLRNSHPLSDSPMSPITQSLTRFSPTPAVFDLLSFGRTAIRQSANLVQMGVRTVHEGLGKAVASVRG